MTPTPVIIEAVPAYTGLDGRNADNYYRATQRSAFMQGEVLEPFCGALKEFTEYDSDNIPDSEKEISLSIGRYGFLLKATPTARRPGYKAVFEDAEQFLDTKLEEYEAGERPRGILTIEDEPYIAAKAILSRIEEARETGDLSDVNISIADITPWQREVYSMVVPLGIDMSELTEGNAARYLEAHSLNSLYKELITDFEEHLLSLTGFDNDNPPMETEHMYRRLGEHIFHVRSVPYQSTEWGKVVGDLVKEPPKRRPENGGDLVLIERGIEVPRLETYRTRIRGDNKFVRLNGLLSRMEEVKENRTKTKVRQRPINHYPIV